jgi:hypothetical protein
MSVASVKGRSVYVDSEKSAISRTKLRSENGTRKNERQKNKEIRREVVGKKHFNAYICKTVITFVKL